MSQKKSNLLIPVGLGAAVVVGGAALGYLYLKGAFSDISPLASAKIVPDEALAAGFISTDSKAWSQLQQFGTPEAQQVVNKGLADFNKQMLTQSKIDYEKDIKPWLGSVMVAILPSNSLQPAVPIPPVPGAAAEPNMLIVVGVKDKISAWNSLRKLESQSSSPGVKIKKSNYKGTQILEEIGAKQNTYITILKDHVVVSPQRKSIELAIDTFKGEPSLANKESVKSLFAKGVEIQNPIAHLYVPDYSNFVTALIANNPGFSQLPPESLEQLKQLKSLAMGVGIDNSGIRVKAIGKIDPSAVKVAYQPSPGKVVAQLPLDTMALVSGHGIKQIWSAVVAETQKNPQSQQQFDQMRQQFQTIYNLDLDRDIFGWMDGEFAIAAISSNQGVLAPIGFGGVVVVKTSDRQAAEATLAKLDDLAKQNSITVSERTVQGKTVREWTVPEQGAWIGHGWLDGDSLAIAIGSPIFDAMANNSRKLESSESFKAIAGSLPKPNTGYFYLDVDKTMSLVNQNLPPTQKNSIPVEANAFINSIRGIGMTATQPDASTGQLEVLLALKPKTGK